jgi:hypothetical protein
MFGGSLGTISNQADWLDSHYVYDEDTNDPIDLTGATITLKVASHPSNVLLTVSTTSGEITIPTTGYFTWSIPATSMTTFCAGTYRAQINIERDGEKLAFFLGTITIEEGF